MKYDFRVLFGEDKNFRKKKIDIKGDEFKRIFSNFVLKNIPYIFLEAFKGFRQEVLNKKTHKSKAFFTANALHNNYIYKFFIAEHYKNIEILIMQHGGNYGLDFYYALEEYEKTIIDRFYTAGWKENEKTIPLSIPKFAKKISIKKQSQNPLILLTINEMPRYVYRFQFIQMASSCLNESFAYLAEFLKYTSNKKKINIRSYPNTYKWDINDRLKEKYKDLKFDNLEKTFDVAIKNSDIFVSSCAHTTFLEALAANKPTIIVPKAPDTP